MAQAREALGQRLRDLRKDAGLSGRELTVKQPREIALYQKTFSAPAAQAVTGRAARALITAAVEDRQG